MIEIFIEGKRLDVSKDEPSLLTYQVDDIKDFTHRNSTFSKTIVLPGTANNNKLFGSIFDVRVSNPFNASGDNVETNFNPSIGADCLIFQNRLQVFKGTLRVLEIVVVNGMIEYEVSVFGELGGLVSAIGTDKLEDLDFSAYDQVWNVPNVTGSWESLNGSGVLYPLIDYGQVSTDKINYDIRAFRPALYVREYVDKIITGAGYTWSSDLFNTARFKSLIIPNNQQRLSSYSTKAFSAVADVCESPCTYDGDDVTPVNLGYGTVNYAGDFTASLFNTRFTYGGAAQLNASVTVTLTGYLITTGWIYFNLYKNGTYVGEFGYVEDPGDFVINGTVSGVSFSNTDYFEIKAETQAGSAPFSFEISSGTLVVNTDVATPVPLNYGETIDINATTPRGILQRDFLSSIIRLFNLYIYEDNLYPKKLMIAPYVDFYDLNPSGVVDWDYKLDRGREMRIRPMSELNSRYYNFRLKQDNDYYNELYRKTYNKGYGDYIYDSAYEFADDSTDMEVIFSGTPMVGYSGKDKIVSTMFKKTSAVEENYATNIRILQAKKITGVTAWNITDNSGATTLASSLTDYGYAGHYDDPDAPANDIQFGVPSELFFTLVSGAINVTQFNVYWSPYMTEITDKDSRLLTCWAKLNNADIFSLNFSKLIYADGVYWRLNKVEDWNAAQPDVCKVELLKVINLIY